ncbi:HGxxPAAW family protein [Arthrobacter sp. A5]|uniref:HGxxPAAW family protein n=1 Tax=Arthrobacter sp. A5 TaxID=576926 RepID=UPI003DA97880
MSNNSASTGEAAAATQDVDHSIEVGHGNSPAAWTTVAVMLVGAAISCVGFVLGKEATVLFIVGVVIMVLGLGVGYGMRAAGYGVGGSKLKNDGH